MAGKRLDTVVFLATTGCRIGEVLLHAAPVVADAMIRKGRGEVGNTRATPQLNLTEPATS